MIGRNIFPKCVVLSKIPNFFHFIKASFTHDKNFYFFRNKTEYKNLVIPLSNDHCKIIGPGFSFQLKEHNMEADKLFSLLLQRDYVMKLSIEQLKDILCLIANSKINTHEHHNVLKYLDEKCALSAERWNLDLTLRILDAWFIILGKNAFKRRYYGVVTGIWGRKMKKCTKLHLILMLYFVGMSKTAPPFLMEMIEDKMENFASQFTDEEWAIACVSFFKTSKPFNSKLLLDHSCNAAKNLLNSDDRFHLISILKCFRLSKHYDENLWCMLSEYIKNEYKAFNFVECAHFLAVFASQTLYEKELYDCLEYQGLKTVSSEENQDEEDHDYSKIHPSLRSRVKDIARFLWSISSMSHLAKAETLESVSSLLENRFKLGEFEPNSYILVDCLQSFIMLNYYPQNLIKNVLQLEFVNKIVFSDRAKPKYQMFFVLNSVQIEYPDAIIKVKNRHITTPIPKALSKELKERNGFQDLFEFLKQSVSSNIKYCYIFPHIVIGGIILSTDLNSALNFPSGNKRISCNSAVNLINNGILSKHCIDIFQEGKTFTCVEILDPSVCIRGTTEPLGLMKAKIHQLKKLNFHVITLTPEEINTLISASNSENFSKYLKEFA
ncbi:FAST kinase domain-containing protein 5, mitochondrial-like [Uloborus diversus]|uniref:FAST kinase domain-containing protein 5, mitochondrial-like n=1 Tax=Uloborus diversus TaxID=327109 RepID=UPI00240A6A32|nr:FAST kinase domain-containing protein 5, mitochondrial-like [Uloborus diversus]